jgi:hypothetical protein
MHNNNDQHEAKAAEDARRAAEAKAAEDARRAAEAKAAEYSSVTQSFRLFESRWIDWAHSAITSAILAKVKSSACSLYR